MSLVLFHVVMTVDCASGLSVNKSSQIFSTAAVLVENPMWKKIHLTKHWHCDDCFFTIYFVTLFIVITYLVFPAFLLVELILLASVTSAFQCVSSTYCLFFSPASTVLAGHLYYCESGHSRHINVEPFNHYLEKTNQSTYLIRELQLICLNRTILHLSLHSKCWVHCPAAWWLEIKYSHLS